MAEPTSISLALSGLRTALRIISGVKSSSSSSVDNQLKKAFKKAVRRWSPNPFVRSRNKNLLRIGINKWIESENLEFKDFTPDLKSFLPFFDKAIAEYQSAFSYLADLKDRVHRDKQDEQHSKLMSAINNIQKSVNALDESELELEWQRQVSLYSESLKNFKPKTALEFLTKLQETINDKGVQVSNEFRADIEYLKSQCFDLQGYSEGFYASCIKAYELDTSNELYIENAIFSYLNSNQTEKSVQLIDDIIVKYPGHPTAWAARVILDPNKNLLETLKNVPAEVLSNHRFKRLIFSKTFENDDYQNVLEAYKAHNVLIEIDELPMDTINIENFKDYMFSLQSAVTKFIQSDFINFQKDNDYDLAKIEQLKSGCKRFLDVVENSDLKELYPLSEYMFHYFSYILTKDGKELEVLSGILDDIPDNDQNEVFVMMLANKFQLADRLKEGIKVIDKRSVKTPKLIYLNAFCHIRLEDYDGYVRCVKEYLKAVTQLSIHDFFLVMNIPPLLSEIQRLDEFTAEELLEAKKFDISSLNDLYEVIVNSLISPGNDKNLEALKMLENDDFITSKDLYLSNVAYCYFINNAFEDAIRIYEKCDILDVESQELFYYILSLHKSGKNNKRLLELLEKWRTEFSFNPLLSQFEINLSYQLPDWKRCIDISEYIMNNSGLNETVSTIYLVSLHYSTLSDKKNKIDAFVKKLDSKSFPVSRNAEIVTQILVEYGYYDLALQIIYQHAVDPKNGSARSIYFSLFLNLPPKYTANPQVVADGNWVEYEYKNEQSFLQVSSSDDSSILIGHKVNDEVEIELQISRSKATYKILSIFDNHGKLRWDIMKQVDKNPLAGIPFESGTIPEDAGAEFLIDFLKKFAPDQDDFEKKRSQQIIEYYGARLSFTELAGQIFRSDFISTYFTLAHQEDGIMLPPRDLFNSINDLDDRVCVLDFSAMMILYFTSKKHTGVFKQKFLIANSTVEILRRKIASTEKFKSDHFTAGIKGDEINAKINTSESIQEDIKFLTEILDWVKENCEILIPASKLDVTRNLDASVPNELISNYLIETLSILEENKETILISDDLIFYKLVNQLNKTIISSEYYLGSITNWDVDKFSEFKELNYIGLFEG